MILMVTRGEGMMRLSDEPAVKPDQITGLLKTEKGWIPLYGAGKTRREPADGALQPQLPAESPSEPAAGTDTPPAS